MKIELGLGFTGLLTLLGACGGTTVLATGTGGAGGSVSVAGNTDTDTDADAGEGAGCAVDASGASCSVSLGGANSNGGANSSGGANPSVGAAGVATGGSAGHPPLPLDDVDGQKQSDKLDVLFVLDNSVSMAGKQSILAKSASAFVARLVNPRCVDDKGNPVATQPTSGDADCDSGTREFTPVTDMHIGAITSSLGAHGGQVCATASGPDDHLDDKAELLATLRQGVTTYGSSGFLSLDSTGKAGTADASVVASQLSDLIVSAGEHGCGYEATLESMYRFLADPQPPASVELDSTTQQTVRLGVDTTLLAQRAAFLRPDSSLAIVILSDENDCSVRDDGVGWFVGSAERMPQATIACANNPADPCCRSCAQQEDSPPDGCAPLDQDPVCSTKGSNAVYATWDPAHDSLNLRCFNQKGRFGFDLLYEIERYTNALTNYQIYDDAGDLVDNPLFAARDGKPRRSNSLISVSLLVGTPWQDVASSDSLSSNDLTFLSESQLQSAKRWPMLIGDTPYAAPSDPLMIESITPRSGTSPIDDAPLVSAKSTNPLANPGNGHEQNVPSNDDLQYACTFPLPAPVVCAAGDAECDCSPDKSGNASAVESTNSPVCQPPSGGPAGTTQYFGRGYPGARELTFGKALGVRTAVGSICPKNTSDESSVNYGYVPALNALIDRIAVTLK